jgi:hypothetical protein
MNVVYSNHPIQIQKNSIFLAGPTPRSKDVKSWRPDAHLENCSLVVFWVPRKFPDMPALTTNVEFGSYVRSGRMLYGRPNDSEKNRYLLYTKLTERVPHTNLNDLLKEAVDLVKWFL